MYKYILIILFPITLFSQKNNLLTIKGTLINFKENPKFIYAYFLEGSKVGLDSFKVVNSKYVIKQKIYSPILVTLHLVNPNLPYAYQNGNVISFISEATTVTVNSTNDLSNTLIKGSKANSEDELLKKLLSNQYTCLIKLYYKKPVNEIEEMQIKNKIDSIENEIKNKYLNYFKNKKNSLIKSFVLRSYCEKINRNVTNEEISNIENMYELLSINEKNSYNGKKINKLINSFKIEIGHESINFIQKDTSGNDIELKKIKGKYVLIDFWASWCGPCRKEIPNFMKVYEKFKHKNFEIIGVSLDKDKADWVNAINTDKISWINVSDLKFWNNEIAMLYKISAIPTNFLINLEGKIIAKNITPYQLEELLNNK